MTVDAAVQEFWRLVLHVTIPAIPVAQPRARATAFRGRARMFTPTKIKQSDGTKKDHPIAAFKATVRCAVDREFSGPPLQGPLRVDLTFVLPRPKSLIWKSKPMPRLPHTGKPDRDNLDKACLDALTGRLWGDDKQVFAGTIRKWIASGTEQPHVEMSVYEWNG